MTFKTTLTDLILSNRALELVPERPLTTMGDASIAGRAVQTWYKQTVAWLLERHHWNLAVVKSPAMAVTNTRPAQWRYAFEKPDDCAFLIDLTESNGPTSFRPSLRTQLQGQTFEVIGDVIFSNIDATAIEHTSYEVTEADFDEEFAGVIVLALAARLQLAITKRPDLSATQQGQANQALADAIQRSDARDYPTYGGAPSETQVILSNRALALLPHGSEMNGDAQRTIGRLSRTWWASTVGWLLEQHHWNLSTVRTALTPIESDRDWLYAFTVPDDCAFLTGIGYPGVVWGWRQNLSLSNAARAYERVGPVIYSNIPAEFADYSSYDVDAATFSEEFCDIIVTMLAARFAASLTKNVAIAEKLKEDARQAMLTVLARDLNANMRSYGNTPTESEYVRGVGASWAGWLPGADNTFPGTDFDAYSDPIGLTIVPDVPSDSPPGQYYYEG